MKGPLIISGLAALVCLMQAGCGRALVEEHVMSHGLPDAKEIKRLPPDGGPEFNRLVFETSPYLRQHARNPVDWYPWGEAAFAKARAEDKPVFLSVGYSSCHWCHVMAHESFENEAVAELLNRYFVSVKVDREERPDLDAIYMKATQLMTQRGGWPNSVFLTPEGRPWYAGTYFPPEDRHGMPGFKTVLNRLNELWQDERDQVRQQADQLEAAIRKMSLERAAPAALSDQLVTNLLSQLSGRFDAEFGGFGGAPKFPPHAQLAFLLDQFAQSQDEAVLQMVTGTLDALALGGVHDHVGGGFHRYATDRQWLLPHFEKMLYDNAQLLRIYARAWKLTGYERYRETAEDIFAWLQREMTALGGGFYSALDADSEGEEGKFYVWSQSELESVLGTDAVRFAELYQFKPAGNFRDEATRQLTGMNIPHLAEFIAEADAELMAKAREKLLKARATRIRPGLDDKILAAWNGLMIGALAYAGEVFENEAMLDAASTCAAFIQEELWQGGQLYRSYNRGQAKHAAYLDDYAFCAAGLLDLHEATGERKWLVFAQKLVTVLNDAFAAPAGGYFFTARDHEKLLTRSQDIFDNVTPSGNGVAARVLVRLGQADRAEKLLQHFSGDISQVPSSALSAVQAWQALQSGPVQVTVAPLVLKPGLNEVAVRIQIARGWHINSNQPRQDYLQPTAVSVSGAEAGPVSYPAGQNQTFGFSDDKLSVYEGEVLLRVPLKVKAGSADIEMQVEYQPCTESECQAPVRRAFRLSVEL